MGDAPLRVAAEANAATHTVQLSVFDDWAALD
jgi:hypothetical protein